MTLFVKDRTFYKRILTISAPIAAQQVITSGVNMMDTIMLGQVGETAMAASSMATQAHNLFMFMCMGMGMGASVLIARYWGSNDRQSLRKTLTLLYRFCLGFATLYTLVVALFPRGIMRLLTPDQSVIAEGIRYLRWSLPCYFLFGTSLVTTTVLRNIGHLRLPLFTSIGAFFINVFFNWVFIFGKLGAPAMGVAGAALGTTISRCFEFSCICGYLFFKDRVIAFRPKDILAGTGDLLPEYVRVSVPVMISDTLLGLGNSMVIGVGGRISKSFMSANSITSVAQQLTSVFTAALGQAAAIITGNTLGEGDADKAQRQGVSFAALSFSCGVVCGLLVLALTPLLVGFYNVSPETRDVALELMHSLSLLIVFILPGSVLTKGVLRGGGDTRFLMVADVIFLWAVSVPLGYLAGVVLHWPPFWVYFFLRLDNVLKSFWCLGRLHSRKWIKHIRPAADQLPD